MLVVWLLLVLLSPGQAQRTAQHPDLSAAVEGRYIVAFQPLAAAAGSPAAAAASVVRHVHAELAAAGVVQSASVQSLEVVHTLGQPSGSPEPAIAAQEPVLSAGAGLAPGLQAVVMQISHPAALAAVKAASSVRAVVPDRVVAVQQSQQQQDQPPDAACADPQQLSQGLVPAAIARMFFWKGCRNAAAELRWIGERCGDNMDQVRYTAVYAVYNSTPGLVIKSNGQDCILTINATAHSTWNNVRFGSCGRAPLFAPSLPTCVSQRPATAPTDLQQDSSSDSSGGNSSGCVSVLGQSESTPRFGITVILSTPVPCGSRSVRTVTYYGTSCGPDQGFVQWYRAVGPGCTLLWRQGQVKYNNDVFGSCGVPPGIPPANNAQALPTLMCPASVPPEEPSPSPSPPPDPDPSPSPLPEPIPSLSPEPEEASPSPWPPAASPSPSPDVEAPSPSPSPSPEAPLPSPSAAPEPPRPSPSPSPEATPPSPSPSPNPLPEAASPSPSPPPIPMPLAPSPSPAPAWQLLPGALPRSALLSGELAPSGVKRIEAVTPAGVVDSGTVPAERQVLVGVVDSGMDASHPDLNVAGGLSWVTTAAAKPNDTAADVDNLGHGTQVAGTIGARNNGLGVVGVSPGVPLFSLKVLNGDGRGVLSAVISAIKWVAAQGARQGVRVVNISLAAFVDPRSPDYAATKDLVCAVFKEASDAGVLVVVAAGNYAAEVEGYLPASCPTVAVVTALDADGLSAAGYTNYMPAKAPASELARLIAAPGTYITSTVSSTVGASGYTAVMSGTSSAAPHVAGVAANCILNGACSGAPGYGYLGVMQAAAQQRYQLAGAKAYGFGGDPDRSYGLLAWAGGF